MPLKEKLTWALTLHKRNEIAPSLFPDTAEHHQPRRGSFFLLSQSRLKPQSSPFSQLNICLPAQLRGRAKRRHLRCHDAASAPESPHLVEVFRSRPHLLPCLVQELDTDAEKLLKGSVMGEEHRVEVVAGLTGWREEGNKGGCLRSEMRRAAGDCAASKVKVRWSDLP